MNTAHISELSRQFVPNSHNLIAIHKPSHLFKGREFINYKPISSLDCPVESEPIHRITCTANSMLLPDIIELPYPISFRPTTLAVDYQYISKGCRIAIDYQKEIKKLTHHRQIELPLKLKKQLFLDLDESIAHTYLNDHKKCESDIFLSGSLYISHRPYLDIFLKRLYKLYDIIV